MQRGCCTPHLLPAAGSERAMVHSVHWTFRRPCEYGLMHEWIQALTLHSSAADSYRTVQYHHSKPEPPVQVQRPEHTFTFNRVDHFPPPPIPPKKNQTQSVPIARRPVRKDTQFQSTVQRPTPQPHLISLHSPLVPHTVPSDHTLPIPHKAIDHKPRQMCWPSKKPAYDSSAQPARPVHAVTGSVAPTSRGKRETRGK